MLLCSIEEDAGLSQESETMIISPQTSEIPSGAHDLTPPSADLRLTPTVSDGATPFPSTSETQVDCASYRLPKYFKL